MPVYAERLQDYASQRQVTAYVVRDRAAKEYRRCDHFRLVAPVPRQRSAEPVEDVLRDLRSGEFSDRAVRVRQGREARFLEKDPLVGRLVQSIKDAPNAGQAVELCLEELFGDLRAGELFEHTEVVMAILFALKQANVAMFKDVAAVFAESRASEIGRLRHLARALLSERLSR